LLFRYTQRDDLYLQCCVGDFFISLKCIHFFFLYARNWKCDYFAFYNINYTGCNTHKTTKSHYKTQIMLYLSCPSSKNTFWSTTSHYTGAMQKKRFQTNIIARIIIWFLDFANDQFQANGLPREVGRYIYWIRSIPIVFHRIFQKYFNHVRV